VGKKIDAAGNETLPMRIINPLCRAGAGPNGAAAVGIATNGVVDVCNKHLHLLRA